MEIGYALEHGADNVVLVGYIVTNFLYRSSLAGEVRGVILDAPMLDLNAIIQSAAGERNIPGPFLTSAKIIARYRFDLQWEQLNYLDRTEELGVPILLFHGAKPAARWEKRVARVVPWVQGGFEKVGLPECSRGPKVTARRMTVHQQPRPGPAHRLRSAAQWKRCVACRVFTGRRAVEKSLNFNQLAMVAQNVRYCNAGIFIRHSSKGVSVEKRSPGQNNGSGSGGPATANGHRRQVLFKHEPEPTSAGFQPTPVGRRTDVRSRHDRPGAGRSGCRYDIRL